MKSPPPAVLPLQLGGKLTISYPSNLGKIASFTRDKRVTSRGDEPRGCLAELRPNGACCLIAVPFGQLLILSLLPTVPILRSFSHPSMRGLRISPALAWLSRSELNFFAVPRYGRASSPLTPAPQRRFLSQSIILRPSLSAVLISRSSRIRIALYSMADNKGRKQATLGYVRDSQLTIGCVNGGFSAIVTSWSLLQLKVACL